MTDDDAHNDDYAQLEARHQRLMEPVRPAVEEAFRLVTEEGVDPDDLRFELRPVD